MSQNDHDDRSVFEKIQDHVYEIFGLAIGVMFAVWVIVEIFKSLFQNK